MIGWLISLINPLGGIVREITQAHFAAQNANTEQSRIAANERIKALEARKEVLVASMGHPLTHIMRALFALPIAIYLGKIFLWDKVFALGSTDPLSPMLTDVMMIVLGGYFLIEAAKILRGRA